MIQDLEGVRRPPVPGPEIDVPANALEALGFVADTRHVPAGALFAIALGTDPAPALAFVNAPAAPALAARTRHRGASVKRPLMTAAVALAVLARVLF